MVEQAADPLAYLLARAEQRFDLESGEGSRRAAEWILGLMSHVPATHHLGLEVKQAKVLDTLSHRLRVPLETLNRLRRQLRRPAAQDGSGEAGADGAGCRRGANGRLGAAPEADEIRQSELDRTRPGADPDRAEGAGNCHMAHAAARPVRHSRMHLCGKSSRCATTCKMKVKFRAMRISWFGSMIRRSARWRPA